MMLPNNSPSLFHYLQNVSISLKDKFRRLDEVSICDNDLIYCEDLNTQQITYDRNTNILGYSKKKLTCNLLENQIHKRHKLFHTITRRLITRDQLINLSYNVYCKLRYWAYDKKRTLIEICEQTYPILTDTEKLPYLFVHFCKIHQVSHPFGCSSMDVGIYEPSGQLSPVHRPFKWQLYTIQEKIIKGECGFMNKHTFLSERGRQCMALVANGLNQKEISDILCIGEASVKTYIKRVNKKINMEVERMSLTKLREFGRKYGYEKHPLLAELPFS